MKYLQEFNGHKVSRQYVHAMKKHREGRCQICTEPLGASKWFCNRHLLVARALMNVRPRSELNNITARWPFSIPGKRSQATCKLPITITSCNSGQTCGR